MQQGSQTLTRCLLEAWRDPARAATIALLAGDTRLSYAQLDGRVRAAAAGLQSRGVGRGDRVALAMERSPDLVVWILATMAAGACVCPLEPALAPQETARRMVAVGITALVRDEAAGDDATLPLPAQRRWPAAALARAAAEDFQEPAGLPGDAALLLFTSGSTGAPKGVLLTQGNLLANALGVIRHSDLTAADRFLHVMPLYHSNGLNNQLFAPLLAGASIALCPRFKADAMPQWLDRYRPTIVTGVPTMYNRMLDQRFEPASLAGLRLVRCGSAPITEEQQRRIEQHLGCELVISYGLSEATCTSTMNPPGRRRIGSIGTVIDGQEVTLRGSDGRHFRTPGLEGEICIAGPTVMAGYVGASGPGALEAPAGGMLRTGDLGRFDEDGYLYITGRMKDVIIRGGENLSPARIESVLAEYPGVRQACVVGRAHPDLGEVPVACVVRAQGCDPAPDALGDFVAERLGRIYRPAEILWLDALPENSIGKVDRKAVAQQVGRAGTAGVPG